MSCNSCNIISQISSNNCKSSFNMNTLNFLNSLLEQIDILLFMILEDKEQGLISNNVRNASITLFNSLISEFCFIIQNSQKKQIKTKYDGTLNNNATYFGITYLDISSCKMYQMNLKKILAFNGTDEVSIDRLTINGTNYIPISNNYPVVTFSQALCELKKHINFMILSFNDLCC